MREVTQCLNQVYHVLSRYAHGHKEDVVIEERFHPANQRAGLVALMKVQDKWNKRVVWKEVKSGQEHKK